jgi:hypothetical protein
MARAILIHHVPQDLKVQMEQLPQYGYGNTNDLYIKILKSYIQSPEVRLIFANRRIADLELENRRLRFQLEQLTQKS